MCVLSHSVVSDSVRPHGLWPTRLCPWDSPGKNTGVGCHALLQGTFPTLGLNPGPLHCRHFLIITLSFKTYLTSQGSHSGRSWCHYCNAWVKQGCSVHGNKGMAASACRMHTHSNTTHTHTTWYIYTHHTLQTHHTTPHTQHTCNHTPHTHTHTPTHTPHGTYIHIHTL